MEVAVSGMLLAVSGRVMPGRVMPGSVVLVPVMLMFAMRVTRVRVYLFVRLVRVPEVLGLAWLMSVMLVGVVMRPPVALDVDLERGGLHAVDSHPTDRDLVSPNGQRRERRTEAIGAQARTAGIEQCAHRHVTADTGSRVEVGDLHREIRANFCTPQRADASIPLSAITKRRLIERPSWQ